MIKVNLSSLASKCNSYEPTVRKYTYYLFAYYNASSEKTNDLKGNLEILKQVLKQMRRTTTMRDKVTTATAAARGAPRHDQRKDVWSVYETRTAVQQYLLYMYTGGVGRKSAPPHSVSQNRTSAHPDKKYVDRQTDRQTTFELEV